MEELETAINLAALSPGETMRLERKIHFYDQAFVKQYGRGLSERERELLLEKADIAFKQEYARVAEERFGPGGRLSAISLFQSHDRAARS